MTLGVSAFPSNGKINTDDFVNDSPDVQKAIKGYRNKDGEPLEYLQFNKGL